MGNISPSSCSHCQIGNLECPAGDAGRITRIQQIVGCNQQPADAYCLDRAIESGRVGRVHGQRAQWLPRRGDVIADNVAASVGELRNFTPPASLNLPQLLQALPQLLAALPKLIEVLPNLVAVLPQLIDVGRVLQPVLASPEFEALLNSGVLDPKTVSFVGQTGTTLVESLDANQRHPQQMGAWGLLQALRDPDLQRALGFFVNFGKRFGQNINQR